MYRIRVVAVLLPWVMAAAPSPVRCGESGPARFRVRIEGGVAAVQSAPASLEATTGWKQPCVLELDNRDAVPREVSLAATLPVRIVLPEPRTVLPPGRSQAVPFLLQTLAFDDHEACLTVGSGPQECVIRFQVKPSPDPQGVCFGVLDHFEVQGPIADMPRLPPGGGKPPKKPPIGGGAPKDLRRLTVAPTEAVGERILTAMRTIQDLGARTYRMDISWRIVEHDPGVFSWDRMDWMTKAMRSPRGGGSRLVAQIGYQPLWLPPDFPATREGPAQHARWVEQVVSRYADRVDCWEIWNEPLLFWLRHPDHKPDKSGPPPKPLSAQETDALAASYARMILEVVRGAAAVIRRVDPQATILSPGFEDFFNTPGPVFPEFARTVLQHLLADGMAQHVDGFCIHSYPAGFPGKAPPLDDTEPWKRLDQAIDAGRLVRLLKQYDVHLPLYCTEFGGYRVPRKAGVAAETAAALALLRNGCTLAHQGFRLVTYYELYDWDNGTTTHLVRDQDQYRTRGYSAYQKLIAALTGATACEVRQLPQARIHDCDYSGLVIQAFRRGGEDVLCLWSNAAASETVRLRAKAPVAGEVPIVEHVRFSPREEFLDERVWRPSASGTQEVELTVAPLEFHVLSRTSSSPGFEWLVAADVSAAAK